MVGVDEEHFTRSPIDLRHRKVTEVNVFAFNRPGFIRFRQQLTRRAVVVVGDGGCGYRLGGCAATLPFGCSIVS